MTIASHYSSVLYLNVLVNQTAIGRSSHVPRLYSVMFVNVWCTIIPYKGIYFSIETGGV